MNRDCRVNRNKIEKVLYLFINIGIVYTVIVPPILQNDEMNFLLINIEF